MRTLLLRLCCLATATLAQSGCAPANTVHIDGSPDGSATSPVDAGIDAPNDGATASAGCTKSSPTGLIHLTATDGNGTLRDFQLQVPSSYDPTVARSLSFVFHGVGGTSAVAMSFGLQDAPDAAGDGIFVFPQGVPFQSYGVGWDDHCGGYDMVFFDHMLSAIEADYCIDTARVFAAGFSWGCDFVTALACCRGDRIRAIGAGSCSDEFSNPSDASTYANLTCPVQSKAAIRFTHATDGDDAYPAPLFATTSQLFRAFNGCAATSAPTSPSPCVSFDGCAHPLIECAYPGLGHSLPSNWAADTWKFFARF